MVLGIQRSHRFSPNSVDKDLAILSLVVGKFGGKIISEDNISDISALLSKVDIVFTMARSNAALEILTDVERKGVKVINPADGVRNCQRSVLDRLMRKNEIPVPSADADSSAGKPDTGYWLKRGDAAAQSHADVVFCKNAEELRKAKADFIARGINDYVIQQHVEGDLVKFYGVGGTGFFRFYYPSDDGQSKFGDEKINGKAHHYHFDIKHLQKEAERIAVITSVPVYGGDAIVKADGSFVFIDFNDWPSFSRCRNDAAEAIAALAERAY